MSLSVKQHHNIYHREFPIAIFKPFFFLNGIEVRVGVLNVGKIKNKNIKFAFSLYSLN